MIKRGGSHGEEQFELIAWWLDATEFAPFESSLHGLGPRREGYPLDVRNNHAALTMCENKIADPCCAVRQDVADRLCLLGQ